MRRTRLAAVLCLCACAALADEAAPLPWALPPANSCEPEGGLRGSWPAEDAPPVPFREGDAFSVEQLEVLRNFLPSALWEHRERFFYEGMRLAIGACFADYGPPDFFREITQQFAEKSRLLENGGIADYTAGLPFPSDRMSPDDPQAGQKWAWNVELRYQGAGFWGPFRTSDMVGRAGRAEPFIGEIFKAQIAFRADLPDRDYTAKSGRGNHWVGGGLLLEPFDARHYAWRQYRSVEHLEEPERSDDLHAYLPNYRRVRRVSASGVEGIYMPSFSVGVVKPQVLVGLGSGAGGGGGAAGGSVGAASTSITTKRSGFEGLELRPLLYHFELKGVQDVLAPINATSPSYPEQKEREFGPWGLSFASDTWDLRRAVVLEGRSREERGGQQVSRMILHVDAQTQQPLYFVSYDSREELIDVGMFVGRWSETRSDYRKWPDDPERAVRVIDSVGAAFANIQEGGGWRRESWTIVSTPVENSKLRRDLSIKNLTKRR